MKTSGLFYLAVIVLIIASSCEKQDDFNLSQSVFIEDPYYPGLPIYSEWGYNTFGAYIDRKPFVSTQDDLPAKVIVNNDTIHFIFRGRMGSGTLDMKFSVKGFYFPSYYDLTGMNGITINLKEIGRAVTLKTGDVITVLDIIEGELELKSVRRLYVDEESSRVIMSGYFNFKTFMGDEPIAVSHGRFDLGIGYENFYNY